MIRVKTAILLSENTYWYIKRSRALVEARLQGEYGWMYGFT